MYWFSVTAVTNSYKDGGFKTIEIDSLTVVGVRSQNPGVAGPHTLWKLEGRILSCFLKFLERRLLCAHLIPASVFLVTSFPSYLCFTVWTLGFRPPPPKNLFPNKVTFIGSRDLMIFLLRSSFFFFFACHTECTILGWQLFSLSTLKVVVLSSGFCHFCFFESSISLLPPCCF